MRELQFDGFEFFDGVLKHDRFFSTCHDGAWVVADFI